VAKWWSADGGDRIARTVQHLHGGIGADVTYPIHRYLLWSSQLANTLGSASWHLHQVGGHIAAGTA
jgi:alkylation response protein AidB-like acyl-CoA dehydrogenase